LTSSVSHNGGAPAWLSPSAPPPTRLGPADDRTTATAALARARQGEALVYRGDYRNARQLLAAMGRRLQPQRERPVRGADLVARFKDERAARRREHLLLSRLVVPVEAGPRIPLAHAPDAGAAILAALGEPLALPGILPVRDLLGMIGAHEWRRKGVDVPALGARLHPRYGVFAPVRGEHVDLVAEAARRWPVAGRAALDVGTGTGVLAFVLARAGADVTATDLSPAALASAAEDAARLGLQGRIDLVEADLFPARTFDLVVCNPPWVPGEVVTPLDRAVYDPGGAFLARLLRLLPAHLAPGGEAWLILSDLAERIGLRAPGEVEALIGAAGLEVAGGIEAVPSHPRARDAADPLHEARSKEVTSLRRLVPRPGSG
jgi:methylase of polypeptide subunit release factors